jgi:dethiobiotin synthetase
MGPGKNRFQNKARRQARQDIVFHPCSQKRRCCASMPLAMAKIIFITGTDTGVGKTVVTALLLRHLRRAGCNALAIKPFCSGSRADARLLLSLQKNLLTLDEINPFFFNQPVAPAAAGSRRKAIPLEMVLRTIGAIGRRCDVLLVEGIGGLLVPLGNNYTVADLISRLHCPALIVCRNRLGTINHTLLTVKAMEAVGLKRLNIVMVEDKMPDISARSNPKIIQKIASPAPVFLIPNLGSRASSAGVIKINAIILKKTLARILGGGIFSLVLPRRKKSLINKTG